MCKKNMVANVCRKFKVLAVSLLFILKTLNFDVMSRENCNDIPKPPISYKNSDNLKKSHNLLLQWNKGKHPSTTT